MFKVILQDKFLSVDQCKKLIKFYNSKPQLHQYDTTFPLGITAIPKGMAKDV